jgi:hypothetical protein
VNQLTVNYQYFPLLGQDSRGTAASSSLSSSSSEEGYVPPFGDAKCDNGCGGEAHQQHHPCHHRVKKVMSPLMVMLNVTTGVVVRGINSSNNTYILVIIIE